VELLFWTEAGAGQVDRDRVDMLGQGEKAEFFSLDMLDIMIIVCFQKVSLIVSF